MSESKESPSNEIPFSKNSLENESIVNGYKIKASLSEDFFGMTYSARHQRSNEKVVLREYFPSELSQREADGSVIVKDKSAYEEIFAYGLKQFEAESEKLQTLKHKNIAEVKAWFNENGTAYRVVHYHQGQTLKQWLTLTRSLNKPPLTEKKLLNIIVPVLDALIFLEENEYAHLNLRPENIYLCSNNTPLLIDFGASKQALAKKMGCLDKFLATGFAPKEQYESDSSLTMAADIYALSATIYYAMTYEEPMASLKRGQIYAEKSYDPLVSAVDTGKNDYRKEFLKVVDQGLACLSKDRPQTFVDFKKALIEQQYKNRKKASAPKPVVSTGKSPTQISELILLGLLLFILVQKVTEKMETMEVTVPVVESVEKIEKIEVIAPVETTETITPESDSEE